MPERDGNESRKNHRDAAWRKPKWHVPRGTHNGSSAAKPRTGERSTTIPRGSSLKRGEKVGPVKDRVKI